MKRFGILLFPLLIAALAFGASDTRKAKFAEERAAFSTGSQTGVEGTAAGWLRITPEPSQHDYRGITISPAGAIWITGYNTATTLDWVWRSADGGATWKKTQVLKGEGITEVAVANETTAVFGSFAGVLYRTTNSGATWDSVWSYYPGGGWFNGVRSIGKDSMIAMGDADSSGFLVVRSFDAGKTWTRATNLPTELKEAVGYASYSTYRQALDVFGKTIWLTAYFGSSRNPRIVKSTDGGDTWTTWEVTLTGGMATNYYLRSINMLDENIGWATDRQISTASNTDHWLHKTTDGGLTWSDTLNVEPAVAHANARVRGAKPLRGTTVVAAFGWAGSNTGKVWLSMDAGATWTPTTPGTTGILTNGEWVSPTLAYVVGQNTVLKYTPKNVRAVTFTVNTATVPDTIPVAGSTIQMRGGVKHAGGFSPITWGSEAQNNMTAAGGDYWRKTLYMQVGDTLRYKYVIAYATGTGWEGGVVPAHFPSAQGADRSFVVPDQDTTVQVEFWNNGAGTRPQYFRPYAAAADSFFTVYFRVNMNGIISQGSYGYNGDKDTLAVRGGGSAGSDLDWGRSFFLTRESPTANGDGYTSPANAFWSGGLKIKKTGLTEGATVGYKFLIGSDWNRPAGRTDEESDRSFKVPIGFKDTTLKWVYFNNSVPTARANPDTIRITFIANLAQAAASGGFDVTKDTMYVRTGYFGTGTESARGKRMLRVSGTIFQATDTIVTAKKKLLDYQYYTLRDAVEVRETYYNYYYTGAVAAEAERRQVLVDSTASLTTTQTVRDTATSITQARRQPVFPNGRKLARKVNVKWECDLRPAYYQVKLGGDSLSDIQGTFTVRVADVDSIIKWGVWMNGPAVGGWSNDGGDWGLGLQNNLAKKLYDNGTNGDRVAGDSIFTRQVLASPDSVAIGSKDRVGQTFKFGVRGGDNEGGRGGFGNNHNENIVDTDTIYTMSTQFGSINPAFYDAWEYDLRKPKTPTSVIDPNAPLVYELAQNYPNPFNPATKIEYSIPMQSQVELKIYNLVGQEVGTLVNEIQKAGVHNVKFDAGNLASGVYFYRLVAGNFTSVKKMVLLK